MPDTPLADAGAAGLRSRPAPVGDMPPDAPQIGLMALPRFPPPPRRRRLRLPFLLCVVLPTLLGAIYYGFVAAPQYVTSAVFALRVGEELGDRGAGGPNALVGALGPTTAGAPITQSYGLVHYVGSASAMQDVAGAGLDLAAILGHPAADPLTRLPPDPPPDQLLRAWRAAVGAQFELTRGVVTLRTRAYTPEDSLALAEALLAASERLANQMSRRMQDDVVRVAEEQAAEAESRLLAARAELQLYRATSGVLDPGRASSAGIEIEMRLRQELAAAEAQAESLRASGGQGGPMLAAAVARARALRTQLGDADREASRSSGDRNGTSWAEILARHEALASAVRISEQHYTQALDAMQRARAEAARQRTYLLTFVRPVLPGAPTFPDRGLSILIVAGSALLIWAMATLIHRAITDQA